MVGLEAPDAAAARGNSPPEVIVGKAKPVSRWPECGTCLEQPYQFTGIACAEHALALAHAPGRGDTAAIRAERQRAEIAAVSLIVQHPDIEPSCPIRLQ